jgi:hypothetical protein
MLAGDTFDNTRVRQPFLDSVRDVLAQARLDIVILPGNHDPLLSDSVYFRGGFHDLAQVAVIGPSGERICLSRYELAIWGRPHHDYADMRPLANPPLRTQRWHVVMAHGHFVDDALPTIGTSNGGGVFLARRSTPRKRIISHWVTGIERWNSRRSL